MDKHDLDLPPYEIPQPWSYYWSYVYFQVKMEQAGVPSDDRTLEKFSHWNLTDTDLIHGLWFYIMKKRYEILFSLKIPCLLTNYVDLHVLYIS